MSRRGRPPTGQGKTIYIPDHLVPVVEALLKADRERQNKESSKNVDVDSVINLR